MSIGVIWFGQDLRTADHTLLWQAAQEVEQLICVYCEAQADAQSVSSIAFAPSTFSPSIRRRTFLESGLNLLALSLREMGQTLFVSRQNALTFFSQLFDQIGVTHLYRQQHMGWYEQQALLKLQAAYPDIHIRLGDGLSLFAEAELPFELSALPKNFTAFRKQVEDLPIRPPVPEITSLPPLPHIVMNLLTPWRIQNLPEQPSFNGGELAGLTQLSDYFSTQLPSQYKLTRNALDGWENSTKFSPWLAQGAISAKQIKACLEVYERDHGANESTYWIYFELLWREYFQWYAKRHGAKLFHAGGIQGKPRQGSFYAERFKKWCSGNTPYPIVNACMKQLNETGFMSNRGRQLAASCLIYDLGLDWRYGAAYFESQLVDYDVCSNWGNWQYIAGVGADPRGGRHFNLEQQTRSYDPEQRFIRKWAGHQFDAQLDSVDAADWPILPN